MKKEVITILLVDDHHMILEGYKNVISKAKFEDYDILLWKPPTIVTPPGTC